jgi:ArsR family transcriptional regulator, arsenate/arsenite/antimonite-responsive transcriptional repressor
MRASIAARQRIDEHRFMAYDHPSMNVDLSPLLTSVDCCRPLDDDGLTSQEAEATAEVFKALGDPSRVRIVNLLARNPDPVCVCELTPAIGLSQPTVSHHLKKLVEVGLLTREQRGVWAYYTLDREAVARAAGILDLEGVTV